MRKTLCLVVVWLTTAVAADEPVAKLVPDLAEPMLIEADGKAIDVGGYAAPFVSDFDEDGRNDLLVGQFEQGRLRIYPNVGTNAKPQFSSFDWFRVGSRIACVPSGCRVGFTPHMTDFDGDGLWDVLSGSLPGNNYLFRGNKDGSFGEAELLESKQGNVHLATDKRNKNDYNSCVFVHDWNEDGRPDLLLRSYADFYRVALNEGTRQEPVFSVASSVKIEEKDLKIVGGGPCVADWDGDGRDDLLVCRWKDVIWYRNIGMKGHPILLPEKVLVAKEDVKSGGGEPPPGEPARFHSICVVDFNADGRLDLLLGDTYRERIEHDEPLELSDEQIQQQARRAEERRVLTQEYAELRNRPDGETREERIERHRKAIRAWQAALPQTNTRNYKQHGRVWLFMRIRPGDDS